MNWHRWLELDQKRHSDRWTIAHRRRRQEAFKAGLDWARGFAKEVHGNVQASYRYADSGFGMYKTRVFVGADIFVTWIAKGNQDLELADDYWSDDEDPYPYPTRRIICRKNYVPR